MADLAEFNRGSQKPVVLLSPLDWGLGHTVRCIPIIQELEKQGCSIIIACNSTQKALLSREFPNCRFVDIPGYGLRYATTRWGTMTKIIFQIPKILIRINQEHRWLNAFLRKEPVDGVISDNRFGFCSKTIPSIFITHQLRIKTGLESESFLQRLNYSLIKNFSACWVPDFKGCNSIAGELSNPVKLPAIPVHYLGGLSRLQPCTSTGSSLLIVLSGPEPQRTILERQLLIDLKEVPVKTVLVRGLPGTASTLHTPAHVTVYDHAPTAQLNQLICEAEWVVSRSGYTTVMDLLKLGKKSILIPTPGQAEQEYLAKHLMQKRWAYTVPQKSFSLSAALVAAAKFNYDLQPLPMNDYRRIIESFVTILTSDNGDQS